MSPALRFAEFTLDPDACRLERAGVEVVLQPLLFELLVALIGEPGRVFTREALAERLWPDVHVDDGSLSQAVRRLRIALGDPARQPRFVETLHRRGYRWIGDVRRGADPAVRPTPTPWAVDRFVGRESELRQLRLALANARLVTLMGPGGIGKSRLAAEVSGGVDAVEVWLGACRTTEDVLAAVAAALGLPSAGSSEVAAALGACRDLLVLDEAEGVAATVATLATGWVAAAAAPTVLVTSRVRLGVASERVVELSGLPTADAVALYRERSASIAPGADDPEPTVRRLVDVLGGMPLALELAACRRRVLSAEAVVERLDGGLDLLTADRPDRPAHHRSLRATLDWSWSLLGDPARRAAARVAMFHGTPTLPVLERALGADALALLEELRDHSWLLQREDRFSMPSPLRAYAEEQLTCLGIFDDAAERYVDAVAAGAAERSRSRAALLPDRPDLVRALALARRADAAVALVGAVVRVDVGALPASELHRAVDRAAALPGASPEDRAALWLLRAIIEAGDRDRCLVATDRALQLAPPGSATRAGALMRRAPHLLASAETLSEGVDALEEARSIAIASRDPTLLAQVLGTIGVRQHQLGKFERSRRTLREGLDLLAPDASVAQGLRLHLAATERMLYRLDLAHELATGALERVSRRQERLVVHHALETLATNCEWEGRYEQAAVLLEQGLDALPPGPGPHRAWTALRLAMNHVLRRQAGEARRAIDDFRREGAALSHADAFVLGPLARLHDLHGEWEQADELDAERLALYRKTEHALGVADALMWRAVHAGVRGQVGPARGFLAELQHVTASLEGPLWASWTAAAEAAVALAAVRAGDTSSRGALAQALARIVAEGPARSTALHMALPLLEAG